MSYITRTGNLAAAPELREGINGPYTFARVIVTDRIKDDDGAYSDGPAIGYDVAVSGSQAVNLVEAAKASGNIRVTFSGRYRVSEYRSENGTRLQHEVRAEEIGVSLRGQRVTITKGTAPVADDEPPF